MDLGLANRVAMVAAASKGLGRACAEALAREGALVSICSRSGTATGFEAMSVACDVSAPDVAGFLATVTVPVLEKPFELITLEKLAEQVRQGVAGPARQRQNPFRTKSAD